VSVPHFNVAQAKHTVKLDRGIPAAMGAAVLFGVSTPLVKPLLGDVPPLLLAGLLYAGSGIGLNVLLGIRVATGGRGAITWPQGADVGGSPAPSPPAGPSVPTC
jgi:drug/metabolite transporter (DMT)-like permease